MPGSGMCPLAAVGGTAPVPSCGLETSSRAPKRGGLLGALIPHCVFCMKVSREEAGIRLGAHVQPPLLGLAGGCPGPLGHGYSSGRVMFMFLNQKCHIFPPPMM